MPGPGKTTFAQCVRSNEQIQNHFSKIMWVCVSEEYNVQRILVEMLESLTKNSCAIRNKDTVVQKIKDELGGKNYPLVLDDVWNEDNAKWEDLRCCLSEIYKKLGNRVVATARNENVALSMGTLPEHMYHLKQLKDEECSSIIKLRVFGNNSTCLELMEIGRDIAKQCGEVTLVASVIGGTLCRKRPDGVERLSIKSKIDVLGPLEQNNGIMHVIQLSFDWLPNSAMKQRFAFYSILPKDSILGKEMLIQFWMAEGFLQYSEESHMIMEDIGVGYFNDLISYFFF